MQSIETFFLMVAVLIGSVFLIIFGRKLLIRLSSNNWEKVVGHVRQAVVEEYRNIERTRKYQARIDYDYAYRSVIRSGQHFMRGHYYGLGETRDLLKGYVPGQPIEVFVYKKNPAESALVGRLELIHFVAPLLGGGLMFFGLYRLWTIHGL